VLEDRVDLRQATLKTALEALEYKWGFHAQVIDVYHEPEPEAWSK
jgi:hypothetical protein